MRGRGASRPAAGHSPGPRDSGSTSKRSRAGNHTYHDEDLRSPQNTFGGWPDIGVSPVIGRPPLNLPASGTLLVSRNQRNQSQGEEIANSISHGVGLVAALIGTPFLITQAAGQGNTGVVVGASLFSATTIFLYLASTLYHALPAGKTRRLFASSSIPRSFFLSLVHIRRSR